MYDEKLKTLCAELLRYGTAAQNYKGYCTETPADGNMTQTHRSYLADLETVPVGEISMELPSIRETCVTWAGRAMALDSRIAIRYVVDLSAYVGKIEDLRLVIRYQGIDGKEKTTELTDLQPYGDSTTMYVFDFDGLLAAELRTVLMATVYEGEVAVSTTMLYSPDTYARGKTGALGDLCKALLAYSDAAKSFFLS